jgi:hypothetical protein
MKRGKLWNEQVNFAVMFLTDISLLLIVFHVIVTAHTCSPAGQVFHFSILILLSLSYSMGNAQ